MKEIIRKLFSPRNKVKTIGVICGIIAIIVLVILVIVNPFTSSDKKHQKQLESRLKEIAKDFYENHYYNTIGKDDEQRKAFVKEVANYGIIMDLGNIARTNTEQEDSILKEFDGCDVDKSLVKIYPKEPYGVTNYTVEIELQCDFSKNTYKGKESKTTTTTTTTTKATTTTKKKK